MYSCISQTLVSIRTFYSIYSVGLPLESCGNISHAILNIINIFSTYMYQSSQCIKTKERWNMIVGGRFLHEPNENRIIEMQSIIQKKKKIERLDTGIR